MAEGMWEDMSGRTPKDESERMSEGMSENSRKKYQKICGKKWRSFRRYVTKIARRNVRKNVNRNARKNVRKKARRHVGRYVRIKAKRNVRKNASKNTAVAAWPQPRQRVFLSFLSSPYFINVATGVARRKIMLRFLRNYLAGRRVAEVCLPPQLWYMACRAGFPISWCVKFRNWMIDFMLAA